jgi:hypothetical protein
MHNPTLGPWTTSLDNGLRLSLTPFWRNRMISLSRLTVSRHPLSLHAAAASAIGAIVLVCAPLLSFSKDAVATEQQANAANQSAQQNDDMDVPNYGKVIQRRVNDNGHGEYLIDLDSGKLFERPEDRRFEDQSEFLLWARAQGIDAMGQVKSSYKGLVGFDMIVMPTDAGSWDQRPGGVLENLEAGDPGTPATMDARGGLPATFFVQTREGARGVLQIIAINEDNEQPGPDHIRLRFKPIAEAKHRVNARREVNGKSATSGSDAAADSKPAKDEGSDFLRRLQQAAAPHLKELQEQHGYTVAEGGVLEASGASFPGSSYGVVSRGQPRSG